MWEKMDRVPGREKSIESCHVFWLSWFFCPNPPPPWERYSPHGGGTCRKLRGYYFKMCKFYYMLATCRLCFWLAYELLFFIHNGCLTPLFNDPSFSTPTSALFCTSSRLLWCNLFGVNQRGQQEGDSKTIHGNIRQFPTFSETLWQSQSLSPIDIERHKSSQSVIRQIATFDHNLWQHVCHPFFAVPFWISPALGSVLNLLVVPHRP